MNQLPTTTVDNFSLETMATFTFSQGMVEWLEIHLENLEMLRTSKMFILDLKTSIQIFQLQEHQSKISVTVFLVPL